MTEAEELEVARRRIAELEREVGHLEGQLRLVQWRLAMRHGFRRRLLQPLALLKRRLTR